MKLDLAESRNKRRSWNRTRSGEMSSLTASAFKNPVFALLSESDVKSELSMDTRGVEVMDY